MQVWLRYLDEHAWAGALAIALGSFLVAWLVEVVIIGLLARLAARTKTTVDDQVLGLLKQPVYLTVVLLGLNWSLAIVSRSTDLTRYGRASLQTVAIVIWSVALVRVGTILLRHFSALGKATSFFQPRTQPIFDIVLKTGVLGSAAYLALIAWDINVGAWLASAGIVGIAVGFAARDSLANYFAGLFILADAPYKLGDVIVLDDGTRGRVTDIGLRSTRILTRDDIEINIPNSILGNMKVVNASAGPSPAARLAVDVSVAYGSDVPEVCRALRECVAGAPHVSSAHAPIVYFVKMSDSGLQFILYAWVEDPGLFEIVRHELNTRAYDALRAAKIEIPFPKQDLYIKELPRLSA
ncbi:MAG: mechanosensitive ion channel family protein [Sandaracinaceae bacterium]|nr:mechanosensitive ion channel family protein [Sandaracinaceae bacterium]